MLLKLNLSDHLSSHELVTNNRITYPLHIVAARILGNEELSSLRLARRAVEGFNHASSSEAVDRVGGRNSVIAFAIRMTTAVSKVGNQVAS